MQRVNYPSDLSDAEWALLAPLLPPAPTGRPRTRDLREIVNGIFEILRTGCQWRYLPADYGPWSTGSYCRDTVLPVKHWRAACHEHRSARRVGRYAGASRPGAAACA